MLQFENTELFVPKKFLLSHGIKKKTIENWRQQKKVLFFKVSNETHISYKTIPVTSRKKLPPEKILIQKLLNLQKQSKADEIFNQLEYARQYDFTKYISLYNSDTTLTTDKITSFAQLHSVWSKILDLKNNAGLRDLKNLHDAFNRIYPNKYNSKISFSNAITKASCNGIMSVAIDKRVFGNNNNEKKEATAQINFAIALLTASEGKFTAPEILEKANTYFKEHGLKQYGLSWAKKMVAKYKANPAIYQSRYGQNEAAKKMPFASLKNPEYSNTLWQMDGKTLPFWGPNFQRYSLVMIIDSTSKKIVGSAFGVSENSTVIMDAIKEAVNNTGVLPFEIITDNHSFNETKECENLISLLNKKGTKWTVTSNPQHKAIVERYNQNIDALCKEYGGYLGKGIRSRSIDAVTSDEMKTEFAKDFLSENEVRAISVAVVEKYNKIVLKSGSTPEKSYLENLHPHPITANVFDRAELLTMRTEKLIRRGQITIKRGIEKFEFQLSAKHYQQYNDATVIVKYDDLRDGIYLFNKATGEPIDYVPLKDKINNAQSLQTDKDIELLNKNKGRTTGIKTKGKREIEKLSIAAHNADPEAFASLNKMTTPKNVLQELEQHGLQRIAQEKGVVMNHLSNDYRELVTVPAEFNPHSKADKNPFKITNDKIKIIDPSTEFEDD